MIRIAENADFNWIIRIAGRYVRFKTLHSRLECNLIHYVKSGSGSFDLKDSEPFCFCVIANYITITNQNFLQFRRFSAII